MYVVRNANKAFRVFMHEIAATVYRTVTALQLLSQWAGEHACRFALKMSPKPSKYHSIESETTSAKVDRWGTSTEILG